MPRRLWPRGFDRFRKAAGNALEILRKGRLSAPYRAPFEVVFKADHGRLRHYGSAGDGPRLGAKRGIICQQGDYGDDSAAGIGPVLMIPPLMVSSEIYDISPELSAVGWLCEQGVDVWLVDFGAPEEEEGGLNRTLDDHILTVDICLEKVVAETGNPVHLCGYSQGGLFAYQVAAYRQSRYVASLITFGSPVDLRKMAPVKIHGSLAERFLRAARSALGKPFQEVGSLPAKLTSRGFKVISLRKELGQLVDFFGILHDREALKNREPRRRFLGGEGFVAWPGPALQEFVDEVVVKNRMTSGGFVVNGRTVSLSDVTCPILAFIGMRDDMARPAAVRAIKKVALRAPIELIELDAGHFGLVVGKKAMQHTWPTVCYWLAEGGSFGEDGPPSVEEADPASGEGSLGAPLYELATQFVDGMWSQLGDWSLEAGAVIDTLRWQLPRLARLKRLHARSRINMGRVLAEQALAIPDEVFFLWRGHAFTYAEANCRVDRLARALLGSGVGLGDRVGVLLGNHPACLILVAALNRIGAVSVLLSSSLVRASLEQALAAAEVEFLAIDEDHLDVSSLKKDRLFVYRAEPDPHRAASDLPAGAVDLDLLAANALEEFPPGFVPDNARGADLAMLLFTSGATGLPKAARITNRRWAMAALATAAACRMTSHDTVYCCLPLYRATAMLAAVGSALVGGARLALAPGFSASGFWDDTRRYGVTVVFYAGELCRSLANRPIGEGEGKNPVRLFVGNGMQADVWRQLLARFGPFRVLEFYASTEGNVFLANLDGQKIGSVGRPLMEADNLCLVRYDLEKGAIVSARTPQRVGVDEPGLLLCEVCPENPLTHFDGYVKEKDTERKILRDLFKAGDAWFNTGDILRRDQDGDYWFVGRAGDTLLDKGENASRSSYYR